jgi:class 3 adenylate cyclase
MILVIDDNPENLRVVVDLLQAHGFRIRTARDGTSGIRRARTTSPHLILLDVQMPGINGYETCRLLKEDPDTADIPVIFMTALAGAEDKVRAFRAGGVDYVSKPFQTEELRARIATHLSNAHMQEELRRQNALLEERVAERTQALSETNAALSRFVPDAFLASLGHDDILSARLGDCVHGDYTVMFSDIRGFTTIAEELGPQATFALVNAYCGRMGPVISAHDGYISQYRGDGVLAIFPTPTDGVRAAVAQHAELERLNEEREAEGLAPLRIGVGLHTGPLTLGIIGDGRRLDASLAGDAVNLASRMEGLSKFYGVRVAISGATRAGLTEPVRLRHLDQVRAEGKTQTTDIYEVLDADPPPLRERKRAALPAFSAGQEATGRGDLSAALKSFTDVLQALPEDITTRLWLERTARFLLHGRPDDWVMAPPK